MRDEKDPGTLEMPLPRKRGRPAKFGVAMTPAQRARRYRIVRAGDMEPVDKKSDASLIDAIKFCRREVDRDSTYQPVLDMYVEELVKRYHSSRMDLWDHRKK